MKPPYSSSLPATLWTWAGIPWRTIVVLWYALCFIGLLIYEIGLKQPDDESGG